MDKQRILDTLSHLKSRYAKEGFVIEGVFGSITSPETAHPNDVDILVHTTPEFSRRYRFRSIGRYQEIRDEISQALGYPVDLASSTGMGKTARKHIIDQTEYL